MFSSIFKIVFCICLINVVQLVSAPGDYNYSEETNLFTQVENVNLYTKDGKHKLSDVYSKTPIIMAMIFTRCTGVCSPFLDNLAKSIKEIDSKENFRVLVVSFDTLDDVKRMQKFASNYGVENDDKWIFAITDDINGLNKSIGFKPVWVEERQQFDHDALLVGINENGYIAKKLTGVRSAADINSVIKEINNGFVLSQPLPRENMLFSCFNYDPATGEKTFSFGIIVLLIPAILTSVFLLWIATKKPMQDENEDNSI